MCPIKKWLCLLVTLVFCSVLGAPEVQAFRFDFGEDVTLDVDTTVTYSAGWRLEDPDHDLVADTSPASEAKGLDIGLLNADDGNRNFESSDMINNRASTTMDIDLRYKDYGVFVRPRFYYDWAYKGDNSNDNPYSNNNMNFYGGSLNKTDRFSSETKDQHRDKSEVLDAFVYGTFAPGGHNSSVRIGRQVLSWGEGVFIQNSVSSAMSPIDATTANVPGAELKELFLPVEQLSAQVDLTPNLTLSGYYQWDWEKNRLDEIGGYFSGSDLIDDAAERALFPVALNNPSGIPLAATIDRVGDNNPKDSGQWGLSVLYNIEALEDTEVGLYYLNYHEKSPMMTWQPFGGTPSPAMAAFGGWGGMPLGNSGATVGDAEALTYSIATGLLGLSPDYTSWTQAEIAMLQQVLASDPQTAQLPMPGTSALVDFLDTSSYYLDYEEDIRLIGASISGVVGETSLTLEVSHRSDYPVMVTDSNPYNPFGFTWGKADILQAQMSVMHLFGSGMLWDNLSFTGEVGVNTVRDDSEYTLVNDKSAWGFTARSVFEYFQIMEGVDLAVPVSLRMNPNGVSSAVGTFAEDRDSVAINLDFTYKYVYQLGLGYTNYIHDADKNPLADRDFVSLKMKYTF